MHAHQPLLRTLCFVAFAACAWSQQIQLPVPTWQHGSVLTAASDTWRLAEYTGPHPDIANLYVACSRRTTKIGGNWLSWLPTSGIVSVLDPGAPANAPKRYGINSGLGEVFHIESLRELGVEGVLVAGLTPGTTKVGAVVRWTWPVTSGPETGTLQTVATLPAGTLPARASIVGAYLYVLELQSLAVLRYEDTNHDGVFETSDGTFVVPIPADTPFGVHGFGGFRAPASAMGVVSLAMRRVKNATGQRPRAEIVLDSGGFAFDADGATLPRFAPRVGHFRELVVGQDTVRLVGAPGEVVQVFDPATNQALSLAAAVGPKGFVDVALTNPLTSGQTVRVLSETDAARDSSESTVTAEHSVIIASDDVIVTAGTSIVLTVFGHREGDQAWLTVAGNILPCTTKLIGTNRVRVQLPSYGAFGAPTTTTTAFLRFQRPGNGESSAAHTLVFRYAL